MGKPWSKPPRPRDPARPPGLDVDALPRAGNVVGIRDSPEVRSTVLRALAADDEVLRRHAPTNIGAFTSYYLPELAFAHPGKVHLDLYRDADALLNNRPIAAGSVDGEARPRVFHSAAYALPRGHGKSSTLVTGLTLQVVCEWRRMAHFRDATTGRHRAPYIVIVSDTLEQAAGRLADIREQLERNDRLIRDYGRFAPSSGERRAWRETVLELPDGTIIRAVGSKSKVRGLVRGGRRPSLILVDDLENDEAVATKLQRQKLRGWFFRALIPTGKAGDLLTIVVGTILHNDSLLSRLLERDPSKDQHPGFLKRRYAARFNEAGEPDSEGVHVLWPEYWTAENLDQRRQEIGSVAFAQEYLNLPIDDEDSPFRKEWLDEAKRRGQGRPFVYSPPRRLPLDVVLSTWDPITLSDLAGDGESFQVVVTAWDLAIVEDEKAARERDSDFTVGISVGLTPDERLEVLRVFRKRGMTPGELRTRIVEEQRVVGADVVVVERNAAQRIIELDLRHVPNLPIIGHTTDARKHSVYEGVPSMALSFELGRIALRHASAKEKERVDTLATELHGLGVEQHDDTVMALWMAIRTIRRWVLRRDARRRKTIGNPPAGTYADLFPIRAEERDAA